VLDALAEGRRARQPEKDAYALWVMSQMISKLGECPTDASKAEPWFAAFKIIQGAVNAVIASRARTMTAEGRCQEQPGDYRAARGVLPHDPEPPEDRIRRQRDGQPAQPRAAGQRPERAGDGKAVRTRDTCDGLDCYEPRACYNCPSPDTRAGE
jgi:hypothetical protein